MSDVQSKVDRRRRDRRAAHLRHYKDLLNALLEISNYAGSGLTLSEILQKIVEITGRVMEGQSCSMYLWNEDRTEIVMQCNTGLEEDLVGRVTLPVGVGLTGTVAQTGETLVVADANSDPRYRPYSAIATRDLKAYLCSPMRIREEVIGVMSVRRGTVHTFDDDDIVAFETICKQVANVIERSQMHAAQVEAEKLAEIAVSLSGVAHYIKNLLMSNQGGEYLLDKGLQQQKEELVREGWSILKRSNAKIRELVENMLNYYRDEGLHPETIEVNASIMQVLEDLADRAHLKKVQLLPSLDLRLDIIEFDPNAFQDVMINLISNAIDAVGETSKSEERRVQISSKLDESNGHAEIIVADNGSGISEEDQAKVFNLFFSTKGKQGTGIGLAATRKIVLHHGGKIDFESEQGKGTEFRIEIPLTQSKDQLADSPKT